MINHFKIIKELDFVRIAGTEGEKRAREIISGYCRELGLEPKTESFDIITFEPGTAQISADNLKINAVPFGLNDSIELEGEFVFLENKDVIAYNKNAYKDKIVASMGYTRKLGPDLKKSGIKAYIVIGRPEREALSLSHRQSLHPDGYVPMVTVSYNDGLKLAQKTGSSIKISISQKVHKKKAHNIIVNVPAVKKKDDNLTLAVGHYDTVSRSPGASDNAGGTISLIKALEHFSKHPPKRDLRVIFFSGEELGLRGSQHYVKSHLDEIKEKVGLILNLDVSGDPIGSDGMMVVGTNELLGYCDGLMKEAGVLYEAKLDIYSSDNMPFAVYEVPSVNIARFGGKASFHIHTPGDSKRNVSSQGYNNTITTAIILLKHILNAEIYPVKKEIDSSLKDKIEKYIWNLNYEKPELEWEPRYKK
ncbi:MAG: M20/M25/M40 family metallo-hydrolase [Candidatus Cloacimonetes bacterium]|nr:M20/M25/M40 family metallo-hydrolase [Candidatus Cloacimonadota bacterium]